MQHKVVQTKVINSHLSDYSIVLCLLKGGVQKLPPRIHKVKDLLRIIVNNHLLMTLTVFHGMSLKRQSRTQSMPVRRLGAGTGILWVRDCWSGWFGWRSVMLFHFGSICFAALQINMLPLRKKRLKGFSSPWMTGNLISIRQDRDYFHRKARRSNGKYHWNMYRKLRNYVKVTRYPRHAFREIRCNSMNFNPNSIKFSPNVVR